MATSEAVLINTPLPMVTSYTTEPSGQTNILAAICTPLSVATLTSKTQPAPLPVVTSCTSTPCTEQQSMLSSSHTPLPVVSLPSNAMSTPLPMATSSTTAAQDNIMSTHSHTLKWSRVQNKLVEIDPSTLTEMPTTKQSTGSTTSGDKFATESSLSRKYYEVLTPEQDDIIFISHMDIINSRCSVQLDRISDEQISKLHEHKSDTLLQSTSSDSTKPTVVKRSHPIGQNINH